MDLPFPKEVKPASSPSGNSYSDGGVAVEAIINIEVVINKVGIITIPNGLRNYE